MELLRLKIIEDMEANNEKKWQTVNLEIEKYRNLYFQSRRELELNLTEIERTASHNFRLRPKHSRLNIIFL